MRNATTTLVVLTSLAAACAPDPEPAPPLAADLHRSCRSFGVEVSGDGPAMVLIPGLASPGEVWRQTVRHYRATHRLHVLTLNGFAGRPATPGPVDAALIEPVVRDLLDYLRPLHRPVVVGHSLGGVIALALAARAPSAVGGLFVVDALPYLPAAQVPAVTPDDVRPQATELRQALARMTPDQYQAFVDAQPIAGMVTSPADAGRVREWMLDSSPSTIGQALYDIFTTDLRGTIAGIAAPTAVVGTYLGNPGATRDGTEAVFRAQYAPLAGAQIALADRARHFVMLDDPAWMWAQLDALLARAR
jgi:N-formylmaleamate deformylase